MHENMLHNLLAPFNTYGHTYPPTHTLTNAHVEHDDSALVEVFPLWPHGRRFIPCQPAKLA